MAGICVLVAAVTAISKAGQKSSSAVWVKVESWFRMPPIKDDGKQDMSDRVRWHLVDDIDGDDCFGFLTEVVVFLS